MGLWNRIQSIGSGIKRGIKRGAKWAWDHRQGIGKVISTGLDVASTLGVPYADKINKVVKTISNVDSTITDSLNKESKKLKSKDNFEPIRSKYNQLSSERKSQDQSTTNSQPGAYSLSTKFSGGTKEGSRVNSWKH